MIYLALDELCEKSCFYKHDYRKTFFCTEEHFLLRMQEPDLWVFLCRKGSGENQGNKSVPLEPSLPLACLMHILLCVKEVLSHGLYLSVSSALWPQGF